MKEIKIMEIKDVHTWENLCDYYELEDMYNREVYMHCGDDNVYDDPNGLSCMALYKILTLIDKAYGGNVSKDTPYKFVIYPTKINGYMVSLAVEESGNTIAFRTKELAQDFLHYEDNRKLLDEYFQV